MHWTDRSGTAWTVRLSPNAVVFVSEDTTVEIPESHYARDIYTASHDHTRLVRVERFDASIVFTLQEEQAIPFLRHIKALEVTPIIEPGEDFPEETPKPVHWPKVSPVAVWALIVASLSFLPVLGVIPAFVTMALLNRHRRTVRQAPVWRHSRTLCRVAGVVLVLGMVVSILSTVSLARQLMTNEPAESRTNDLFERGAIDRRPAELLNPREGTGTPAVMPNHLALPHLPQSVDGLSGPACPSPRPVENAEGVSLSASQNPSEPRALARADAQNPSFGTHSLSGGRMAGHQASSFVESLAEREYHWPLLVVGLLVVLLSLTVHEAAHAITAWWMGDDFARRLGRVTLHPLAHIDVIGTVVLPLILFIMDAGVFGWAKPVPVQLENVKNPRRAQILVALAGPGSNLLLAAVSFAMLLGLGCVLSLAYPAATVANFSTIDFTEPITVTGVPFAAAAGPVLTFLRLCVLVNVFLAFFNLIPVPPLDGSWVLEHLFPRALGPFFERIRPYGFLLFLGLIYSGILHYLLLPAFLALVPGFVLLYACTGLG